MASVPFFEETIDIADFFLRQVFQPLNSPCISFLCKAMSYFQSLKPKSIENTGEQSVKSTSIRIFFALPGGIL